MAISDKLTKFENDLKDSYAKREELGATMPDKKNTDNLPDTIASIDSPPSEPYNIEFKAPYEVIVGSNTWDGKKFPILATFVYISSETYDGRRASVSLPMIADYTDDNGKKIFCRRGYMNYGDRSAYGGWLCVCTAFGAPINDPYAESDYKEHSCDVNMKVAFGGNVDYEGESTWRLSSDDQTASTLIGRNLYEFMLGRAFGEGEDDVKVEFTMV